MCGYGQATPVARRHRQTLLEPATATTLLLVEKTYCKQNDIFSPGRSRNQIISETPTKVVDTAVPFSNTSSHNSCNVLFKWRSRGFNCSSRIIDCRKRARQVNRRAFTPPKKLSSTSKSFHTISSSNQERKTWPNLTPILTTIKFLVVLDVNQ